ncbi:VOC family protein [Pseudomonas sp. RIT623]|uniref:bleomycin resistance protein n=1 Tax=Pseudomonas sp. RIT623 TaxID=2559075 RepID=UPI001070462F|nr:VOC family protein [Pseudomonas sp. RIT623]TFF37585.1 VOC family protein [Pseudomonas sp. RIT623]
MLSRNALVPELLVTDLATSVAFWVDLLGFTIAYRRPEQHFVFLEREGAQVMLEQFDADDHWLTAALVKPLGRGINLQIEVTAVAPLLARLEQRRWPLFQACEDAWYRADDIEVGLRQFLVQDPDGYLLRFGERLGERPLA